MNIDVYLYAFFTILAIYMFNAVNWEKFLKKNRFIEAKLIVLTLSFALSYLLTNFVLSFVGSI